MDFLSLILPNWNEALIVAIVLALFGMFIVWIANLIPLKAIRNRIRIAGVFIILAGIIYWLGMSFVQDIFANKKMLYSIIAGSSLIVVGTIVFFPEFKEKNKNKK